MKNIVICSDGTGNTALKDRGTNVFKVFETVDLNGHRRDPILTPQVAIYDDGVGTEDFKPLKIFAGATGFGLSRNVKQLYKALCGIYDPGDHIFLFGFSRGAFTVRTLAGLIVTCGIVDVAKTANTTLLDQAVKDAYTLYRCRYQTEPMRYCFGERDTSGRVRSFKDCCHPDPKIHFMGVWDTVDAVGLPLHISDMINALVYRFKFKNCTLNPNVQHAYHALAVDDARYSFHPLLWDQTTLNSNEAQQVEQVWFSGAHSNVGGGYMKQGMSLVALDWILRKAEDAGLRFVQDDRRWYHEHTNVDDKLYDPRANLGVFYRWKPRDITAICRKNGLDPMVHLSVLERVAHGTEGYAPGNLPPEARVVITPTGDPAQDALALRRANAVQGVLRSAHSDNQPLLSSVPVAITLGQISSWGYPLSGLVGMLAASTPHVGWTLNPWPLVKNGARLGISLMSHPQDALTNICTNLASNCLLTVCSVAGFLAAYLVSFFVERHLRTRFSSFWHGQQQKLRSALKGARRMDPPGQPSTSEIS
jgi:uncharacterized protein (DUF2235 family)